MRHTSCFDRVVLSKYETVLKARQDGRSGAKNKEVVMNATALKKAVLTGIAGTVVMTVFSYVSHYLQFPSADFYGVISGMFHTTGTTAWVIYFGVGVVFAYLYGNFFQAKLPAHSWMRGVVYACFLWGAVEVVLMPLFGMGFFSGSMTTAFGMLLGMGFYGATVGYLYEN